ncbi:unnamed protein product [Trichogramma brassicae]|uniref:Uncharacterized protein n=1 Tax=Trichogramma brassicae TaxID=86971 RepID=A0A6H5IIE7_9HYME|nr:unnamed protein product [Trichogramma brassicae]
MRQFQANFSTQHSFQVAPCNKHGNHEKQPCIRAHAYVYRAKSSSDGARKKSKARRARAASFESQSLCAYMLASVSLFFIRKIQSSKGKELKKFDCSRPTVWTSEGREIEAFKPMDFTSETARELSCSKLLIPAALREARRQCVVFRFRLGLARADDTSQRERGRADAPTRFNAREHRSCVSESCCSCCCNALMRVFLRREMLLSHQDGNCSDELKQWHVPLSVRSTYDDSIQKLGMHRCSRARFAWRIYAVSRRRSGTLIRERRWIGIMTMMIMMIKHRALARVSCSARSSSNGGNGRSGNSSITRLRSEEFDEYDFLFRLDSIRRNVKARTTSDKKVDLLARASSEWPKIFYKHPSVQRQRCRRVLRYCQTIGHGSRVHCAPRNHRCTVKQCI